MSETSATDGIRTRLEEVQEEYAPDDDRPLASFSVVMAIYSVVVAGLVLVFRRSGRALPERVATSDVVLVSVATHKISRLLAKDPITSPLRAPFTRFKGTSGEAELAEEVRGTGARHAIGELMTCPFCLSQWAATGMVFGLMFAPRATRLFAALFTSLAAADVLQFAYDKLQQDVTS